MEVADKASNKAIELYQSFYIKDGNVVDNTLDAFRHTYWNALLTYEFGVNAAKEFTDAHEYGPLKNGDIDTLHEKRAVDMDLLNNASGRKYGTWAKNNIDSLISKHTYYTEIPTDKWDAIAFQIVHNISFGYTNYYTGYTFANDSQATMSGRIIRNKDNIEGLINTNFGEKEILGITGKKDYFYYPPYC